MQNFNIPRAYGLVVGIENIAVKRTRYLSEHTRANANALPGTAKSRQLFLQILRSPVQRTRYTRIIELANTNATYLNVITSIIELSRLAVAGDLVTMMFATHGLAIRALDWQMENCLLLHDEDFSELELIALLKLFAPGVRFNLVFDCCESGTWLDPTYMGRADERMATRHGWRRIGEALTSSLIPTWYPDLLSGLGVHLEKKRLHADTDLHVLGGTQDAGEVNDSLNFCDILDKVRIHHGDLAVTPAVLARRVEAYIMAMLRDPDEGLTWWRLICYCVGKKSLCGTTQHPNITFDPLNQQHVAALNTYLPRYRHYGSPALKTKYQDYKVFRA